MFWRVTCPFPPDTSHLSRPPTPYRAAASIFLTLSVDFDSSPHFSLPASSHPHIAQSNRRTSPTPPAPRPRVHIRRNARQRRHAFTRRAQPRGHLRRNQRACSPRNPGTRLKHSTWSGSALQVSALCSPPPAVSLTTHSSSSAAFWTILAACVPATLSGAIRQYRQCLSLVHVYSHPPDSCLTRSSHAPGRLAFSRSGACHHLVRPRFRPQLKFSLFYSEAAGTRSFQVKPPSLSSPTWTLMRYPPIPLPIFRRRRLRQEARCRFGTPMRSTRIHPFRTVVNHRLFVLTRAFSSLGRCARWHSSSASSLALWASVVASF